MQDEKRMESFFGEMDSCVGNEKNTALSADLNIPTTKDALVQNDSNYVFFASGLIDDLNLSARASHALHRAKISTLGQLVKTSDEDLIKIRNLGAKTLEELREIRSLISQVGFIEESAKQEIQPERPTFIYKNGIEYYDVEINSLALSVRARNALGNASVLMLSRLVEMSYDEIINMRNMGKKTADEIVDFLESYSFTPAEHLANIDDTAENSWIKPVCSRLAIVFSRDLIAYISDKKVGAKQFKIADSDTLCGEFLRIAEDHVSMGTGYFSQNITFEEFTSNEIISAKLKKCEHFMFCIKTAVLHCLKSSLNMGRTATSICDELNFLGCSEKLIRFAIESLKISEDTDEDCGFYYPKYETLLSYIDSMKKERERFVLWNRLQGKTQEEIGVLICREFEHKDTCSLSRERVRQIEKDALRQKRNVREDKYIPVFKKYSFSKEDFTLGFKEPQYVYCYLNLICKHGSSPIEELMDDELFPDSFRRAAEKIVYKNCVNIGNERIPRTRAGITEYIIRTAAKEKITYAKFSQLYNQLICDLGLADDSRFKLSERGYENRIAGSMRVLWQKGKAFRYYDISALDVNTLIDALDFSQYKDIEISSLKLFNDHPDLMREYDIRDEYELHNLLNKICGKDTFPDINFGRMPTISFGKPNRQRQVVDLLLSCDTPIKKEDFYSLYEQEYGVKAPSVIANYVSEISQYLQDGYYVITQPPMPDIMLGKFKESLSEQYYTLDTLRKIFCSIFPGADTNLINTYNIAKLGYKLYSGYVTSSEYSSATAYFNHLLEQKDCFTNADFPNGICSNQSFNAQLYKKRSTFEIVEFMPGSYINISKFKAIGVDKNDFIAYIDAVKEHVKRGEFFTVKSLREAGFEHGLDNLGCEDWFYSSLLIEDKESFSYIRVGGTRLIQRDNCPVRFIDFIEAIVYEQEGLSIEIYDLLSIIRNTYGIAVDRYKLVEAVRNSDMYYNSITEKVYAEYDIYYEEI